MVHTDIFKKFKQFSKMKDDSVKEWFPNGKDSIRVRFIDEKEIVFTFKAHDNWRFETVESFIKGSLNCKNQSCADATDEKQSCADATDEKQSC